MRGQTCSAATITPAVMAPTIPPINGNQTSDWRNRIDTSSPDRCVVDDTGSRVKNWIAISSDSIATRNADLLKPYHFIEDRRRLIEQGQSRERPAALNKSHPEIERSEEHTSEPQ